MRTGLRRVRGSLKAAHLLTNQLGAQTQTMPLLPHSASPRDRHGLGHGREHGTKTRIELDEEIGQDASTLLEKACVLNEGNL